MLEVFPDARYELFEPCSDVCDAYGKEMAPKLAEHPNFRLHKVALGPAPKKALIHITHDYFSSTTLGLERDTEGFRSLEVDMVTIDDLVEAGRAAAPQVIKIDTQGFELAILEGAERTLPQVEVLLLECWLLRGYGGRAPLWLETADWLDRRGFCLWDFADNYRDPSGMLHTQDCLFINKKCSFSMVKD
jgi:FkbM family methyltransferase